MVVAASVLGQYAKDQKIWQRRREHVAIIVGCTPSLRHDCLWEIDLVVPTLGGLAFCCVLLCHLSTQHLP